MSGLKYFFCLSLLTFVGVTFGQKSVQKGDLHYNHFEYSEAISHYEKYLDKNPDDTLVLRKLGDCLMHTNHYAKAEIILGKLVLLNELNPKYHYYYADALKNNNKFDKAIEQYKIYKNKFPNDDVVNALITSCEGILKKQEHLEGVSIIHPKKINTKYSEFGPYVGEDKLIFTSDRAINYNTDNMHGWTGRPYYSIFKADFNIIDTTFQKIELLDGKVYNEFHNGPACMDETNKLVYFTRIEKGKTKNHDGQVNRAKIYSYNYTNKKSELISFDYNSDNYSVAHPSISKDGEVLYFSSDMPGGFGGQDIYYCVKLDSNWSKPINMGAYVNTSGDEVFPYAKGNNQIYFSSDGHIGFGGLDIYSTTRIGGVWKLVYNMKAPLNSGKDDFGVYFFDGNNGFISSDREGGKGLDDIYVFKISRRLISGYLYAASDSIPYVGLMVKLMDEKKQVIDTTYTDKTGYFKFENLDPNKNYTVKIPDSESGIIGYMENKFQNKKEKIRVYLVDDKELITDSLDLKSNQFFEYFSLDQDNFGLDMSDLMDANFDLTDNSLVIFAKATYEKDGNQIPVKNVMVALRNTKGYIIDMSETDSEGNFEFRNLPSDNDYFVFISPENLSESLPYKHRIKGGVYFSSNKEKLVKNINLYYGGKENLKRIAVFNGNGNSFDYEFIPNDKFNLDLFPEEDGNLILPPPCSFIIEGRVTYDQAMPASGYKVFIQQEGSIVLDSIVTNQFGKFRFENLTNDYNYLIYLDKVDYDKKDFYHMVNGETIFERCGDSLNPNVNLYFAGVKKKGLIDYFDTFKNEFSFKFLPSDYYDLEKLYTEDPEMVLLDFCKIDVNGRVTTINAMPASGYTIYLKNADNKLVGQTETNQYGKFSFKQLSGSRDYFIMIDEKDLMAKNSVKHSISGEINTSNCENKDLDIKLHFAGIKKKQLIDYFEGVKKEYSFTFLPSDFYGLELMQEEDAWINLSEDKKDEEGVSIVMHNLEFQVNTVELKGKELLELNHVVKFMKKNSQVKIEISCHTDSRGTDLYNLKLSEQRAQFVRSYLIVNGIEEGRLEAVGHGEKYILNHCVDDVDCNDNEHAINRRAEFKVIWR